ncbi:MAG: PIN domain-containing protein [Acidobacteriota bacterium]
MEQLIEVCPVVPHDLVTAARYGQLKADLREKGRMIPENDLWIAASALRHEMTLVTRDRHFDAIDALAIETW